VTPPYDGEHWAAVEWSNKHQCWCIEDSTGACLAHQEAIQGAAASKDAAVALATEMIRDGRMPSPQEARQEANQRRWARLSEEERALEEARAADEERRRLAREKRDKQPEVQRRQAAAQQQRERERQAWDAEWKATWRDNAEQPLCEMLNEVFDFADPELWKSNSFAALCPRLIIHLEAVVACLDQHLTTRAIRANAGEPQLAKAREILALLRA
jgi:hypothetical protein